MAKLKIDVQPGIAPCLMFSPRCKLSYWLHCEYLFVRHNIFFLTLFTFHTERYGALNQLFKTYEMTFSHLQHGSLGWKILFTTLYLEGLHLPNMSGHNLSFGLHSSHHSLQVCSVLSHLTVTTLLGQILFP